MLSAKNFATAERSSNADPSGRANIWTRRLQVDYPSNVSTLGRPCVKDTAPGVRLGRSLWAGQLFVVFMRNRDFAKSWCADGSQKAVGSDLARTIFRGICCTIVSHHQAFSELAPRQAERTPSKGFKFVQALRAILRTRNAHEHLTRELAHDPHAGAKKPTASHEPSRCIMLGVLNRSRCGTVRIFYLATIALRT